MKRWLIVLAVSIGLLAPAAAFWQSRDSNYNVAISGGSAFTITQKGQTSTGANSAASPSFAGLSVDTGGLAVAAVCHGPNGAAIVGLTIGGQAATQATGAAHSSGEGAACDIWYATGVTGPTATVAWGGSSWATETRIIVTTYSVQGSPTPSFSAGGGQNGLAISSLSAAVSIPSGGGAIMAAETHSATSGSGTPTNMTLDTTNLVVGASTNYFGHNTTNSGSTTMGVSWGGGAASGAALALATFSP